MKKNQVIVHDIIGTNIAVTSSDAQKLFVVLKNNIENGDESILDFSGITTLTTAFLNESLGTLYGVADSKTLARLVKYNPSSVLRVQVDKIIKVLKNSKEHNDETHS